MQRQSFNAGETIFRAGDPSNDAYLIVTGSVGVNLPNGREVVLETGDVFGEMGLIDQRPRSASVVAREYTVCAKYNEEELLDSIHTAPDEAITLIRALIARLRKANAY